MPLIRRRYQPITIARNLLERGRYDVRLVLRNAVGQVRFCGKPVFRRYHPVIILRNLRERGRYGVRLVLRNTVGQVRFRGKPVFRRYQPLLILRNLVANLVARPMWSARRLWCGVTLSNHRANARVFWPDARGLDLLLLAAWLSFLRYHQPAFDFICSQAHRLRRLRRQRRGQAGTILHVTCSFDLGGTQTQIKNLCQENHGSRYRHEAIEIFPEANFLFRQGAVIEPARYVAGGFLQRMLGRLTVYAGTRSSQIIQIYKVAKDIAAARPQVVVGWGHELCMVTFVAAALMRVPHIVFCIRTFNPTFGWMEERMGRLAKVAHRRMQPCLSNVIVNSTPLQKDYAEWLGIDYRWIDVVANGIDQAVADPLDAARQRRSVRKRFGIADDALMLVHVGRFSAEKGQMSLMQANVDLLRKFPNSAFVWVLCGDGPTLENVQEFVASHAMPNVVFAGRTSEVPAFLSAADIFVMPSDFEGMPNAMMEALAHGLPCVSTDRSGAVDIARNGLEALYYQPRDVARLVEHLTYLFEHPEERQRLGKGGQARMKEFSVGRFVSCFEDLLPAVHGSADARPTTS